MDAGRYVPPGARKWPCKTCGGQPAPEGYDPCVGYLAGVVWACCGHGVDSRRYVITLNGRRFDGFGAFQAWARWAASAEGERVVRLAGLADVFGWEPARRTGPRCSCADCGVPNRECGCSP